MSTAILFRRLRFFTHCHAFLQRSDIEIRDLVQIQIVIERDDFQIVCVKIVILRLCFLLDSCVHGFLHDAVSNRLDPDVTVPLHTGSGGDQFSDDDVLLQSEQFVRLSLDRRFRQNTGRLLEACRRQEAVSCQRCLGDAQQDTLPRS